MIITFIFLSYRRGKKKRKQDGIKTNIKTNITMKNKTKNVIVNLVFCFFLFFFGMSVNVKMSFYNQYCQMMLLDSFALAE